jgi:DNA-binding GntR family transcriptional regulator
MGLRVDDSQAPYLQVAEELRKAIQTGSLKSGDRLPSIRELRERYGIASMTVQNALRLLRSEGLVYAVPGRGSFVRHQVSRTEAATDDSSHTAEYQVVRRELESIAAELRRLGDRVTQLEQLTEKSGRGSKQARRAVETSGQARRRGTPAEP